MEQPINIEPGEWLVHQNYLPGKGNIQYAFWACILLALPLINMGAELEERMFDSPIGYISMVLVLGIAVSYARWRSTVAARPIVEVQFDEAMPADIFALELHRN
jgi:hypothetical protein